MKVLLTKKIIILLIMMCFIIISFSSLYGCQDKEPDYVWYLEEVKVILIQQKPEGKVFVYEILSDGSCEFYKAIEPNSEYYPWQKIEINGVEREVGYPAKLIELFKRRDELIKRRDQLKK